MEKLVPLQYDNLIQILNIVQIYKIHDLEKEKIINSKITNIYYSKEEILEHIKKYL